MRHSSWLVAMVSMLVCNAPAAEGEFDVTWGINGALQVDVSPGTDEGLTLRILRDGKLLLGGTCTGGALASFCATRLLPNGAYDQTFGPASLGYLTFAGFPGFPSTAFLRASAPLPGSGNVFVGDTLSAHAVVARLNDNGTSAEHRVFRFNGETNSYVAGVAVQPDGKIVVAGSAIRAGQANFDFGVARLLPDLSLDTSFGNGGTRLIAFDVAGPTGSGDDLARAVALQADGRIVVAGIAYDNLDSYVAVARLTANGQLDTSFAGVGRKSFSWSTNHRDEPRAVAVDRDGTILVAGAALIGVGAPDADFAVSRLAPDGSFDAVFGLQCPPPFCESGTVILDMATNFGAPTTDTARTLAIQTDGKIILAGDARYTTINQRMFAATRLTRNGEVDLDFGFNGLTGGSFGGTWKYDSATAIAMGNGGLMLAGVSQETAGNKLRFGVGRFRFDLIFGSGFNP